MDRQQLEHRVRQVAEQVLQQQHYVSCIDILLGIGYLEPTHLNDWRKGQVPYLERVIQANLNKVSWAMKAFRQWAMNKSLKPSETKYLARTRGPTKKTLLFSKSGHANIELAYRTHYLSPILSEKKQQKIKEKSEKPAELVVFSPITNAQCDQCNKTIKAYVCNAVNLMT